MAGLDERDRGFAAHLAYETLRWEGTLDRLLARAAHRPLERIQPEVLDVLRLGVCQLLRANVPARAAVDTAVALARSEVGAGATGFVNGVLRAAVRTLEQRSWPPADDVALATGYPEWLVAAAAERFGPRAREVLEAGNTPPGLSLRATGDRAALVAELEAAGVAAAPGGLAPEAVRAPGADPERLSAVAEGRAVPQDEASMLVARATVAAQPSALPEGPVLDCCAGPGGKTTHLAALCGGERLVAAADVHPGRARQVAEAAARLGLSAAVSVVVADGTRPAWRPGAFAAVLVDAPCTGLGVTRRRPEIRWRREPGDPQRLARLQLTLLERAADQVAAGGRLCYAACTWTRAETVGVIEAFLAAHGDRFRPEPPAALLGEELDAAVADTDDPGLQLDPARHGTDGMYLCALRRLVP